MGLATRDYPRILVWVIMFALYNPFDQTLIHYLLLGFIVQASRLTVVSREAKEEAASGAPKDSRLTRVSILQEQEL